MEGTADQHNTPIVPMSPGSQTADIARNLPLGDLLALGSQLSTDTTTEELLQELADVVHTVLAYPQVCIRLRNADTDELEAYAFAGLSEQVIQELRDRPTAPAFYQALLQPHYQFSEKTYLIPDSHGIAWTFRNVEEAPPILAETEALADDQISKGILLVPLRGRGERLTGVIYIALPEDSEAWSPQRVQLLEVITRQAALALENARLAARSARLLAKEQLLAELARDVSTTLDFDVILSRCIERMKVAFQAGTIALFNDLNELEMVASIGHIDEVARKVRLKPGEGICGWVVQQGLPFLSNDLYVETRIQSAAHHIGSNRSIQSYIAVPLWTGGSIIGVLTVDSDQKNAFTYEDVDLLEAIAAQLGGPISSARLYQEGQRLAHQVKRHNEHLTVLNIIARMVVSTVDLERMLAAVTKQIQDGFGYSHVELFLVDEESQEMVVAAQASRFYVRELGYRQPLLSGVLGRAYRTGQTVRVDDVLEDKDYVLYRGVEMRSELGVPVIAGKRVLALLNLESRRVAAFTNRDVAVLETVADVIASAIENARLYQRSQEAAVLEERSRLARDLHDSISQQLFSMTLTAQAARAQIEKNTTRAASQLERLQETATAALGEMRALIFQLRPPALNEQGLIGALHQQVAGMRAREGLTVSLVVEGEESHARGTEQSLYRIAQEALNNIIRHAGACAVNITLTLTPELITLHIADDGCGFEPDKVRPSNGRHLGMISMRERAIELGGTLDVYSHLNQGTTIVVAVPGRAARTGQPTHQPLEGTHHGTD
ncbi:MAG: GAF domain-containing sensor histidine kinase [Chloroflexota bacterium]